MDKTPASTPTAGSGGDIATPRGLPRQLWQSLHCAIQVLRASREPAERVGILDCGGGSGSLAVPLAVLGGQVTVVDVSIDALSTLLRRASEAGVSGSIDAIQGDAESLTSLLAANTFELVLAHDVLSDVSDRRAALSQLAGVTKPGGLLSVVIGNPVSAVLSRALAGDAAGALALLHREGDLTYELADLVSDCQASGLVIESATGLGVFTDLVSGARSAGAVVEGIDTSAALAALESATFARAPYRDIASKIHVLARKPG